MNEKILTSEKIKKTSKVLAILFKVACIFCFVGIGILTSGIIYIGVVGNIDLLVLNGNVIVHSPYSILNINGIENWKLIVISFAGIVDLIVLSLLFKQSRSIFKDISIDDTPFEYKQAKRIRKIAIYYLIISLMDFGSQGVSFSIGLNLVGIVGALMFWCIALIFEYGCVLQKESDETL